MRSPFAVVIAVCALAALAACTDTVPIGPDVRPSARGPGAAVEALALEMLGPADPDPLPPGGGCASPSLPHWQGTARRANDFHYPDTIDVTVVWTRVSSVGCVDTYAPTGSLVYGYQVPGALCKQWFLPTSAAISGGDGSLTIDRTSAPATFEGHAATLYPMTWYCRTDDGQTRTQVLSGGGAWFDARGSVTGGTIAGTTAGVYESAKCGPNGATPCTYTWSFTAE